MSDRAFVYFPTGTVDDPIRREFTRAFNARPRDLDHCERIISDAVLKEIEPYYVDNWRALIAIERGQYSDAERYLDEARKNAETLVQKAVVYQNEAYLRLRQFRWTEAVAACREGLLVQPLAGHYINLLSGLNSMGADETTENVLRALPTVYDLQKDGVLRRHLLADPDLAGVREKFGTLISELLGGASCEKP